MHTYSETKDPSETKDYSFDWNLQLAEGETIATQLVALVDGAGASTLGDSHANGISSVWLSGGNHGGKAIYTIRITTSGGKTLEEAFGVQIVDSVLGYEPTELDRLKALRTALQDAQLAAVGGSVQEVWNGRYGNKMKYVTMTYDQIKAALKDVNNMIADEERVAAGGSRRGGGVGIVWAH